VQAYADSEIVHDLARDLEFERLYRRYVRDVYRYTLAVLRNPADAEDITQTTFLNAYRAFLRGEEPARPRHWLIKIAHNACRSRHLRAVRRPHEVPLEETIAALPVAPDEAPKVEELLGALGRLPFNQRSALVMRELEGRSYAEISDTLDVSVPAVETLIFRARRALRRDRSLLGVLSSVPLPPSLTSFFAGGTGGAVAGGGAAAAGSGVLFKVLLTVTAGVVAATMGTSVDTVLGGNKTSRPAAVVQPDVFVAPSGARAPTSSTGLRGPIVIARDGGAIVVASVAFGAAPTALLQGGLYLTGGALYGTAATPKTAAKQPVVDGGDGQSSGDVPTPVGVSAAPSRPATPSDPVSTTTASATTSVSDTTSAAGVPDVSTPVSTPPVSAPSVPVPVPPPPPVAVPSVPVAVPPAPPLPALPEPPKLP
jgi:RNA polymerase sigma factor (sigma-70 family)